MGATPSAPIMRTHEREGIQIQLFNFFTFFAFFRSGGKKVKKLKEVRM